MIIEAHKIDNTERKDWTQNAKKTMETLIEVKDWNKTANNRNTNNKEDIENIAKGTTD